MSSSLVLEIYLLLLLSGSGAEVQWTLFIHDGVVEDEDDNFDVNNFVTSSAR
jgi:hypothetical protein